MAAVTEAADLSAALAAGPVGLESWLAVAPVVLPLITGAVILVLRHQMRLHGALAIAGLSATVVLTAWLLLVVLSGPPVVMTMGRWLPPFGITFCVDPLGALFALGATVVATACAFHALRAVDMRGRRYGFYTFLMLMMAGVNGAFLTGDIFNLYVWFEVFVVSSFGLLVVGDGPARLDGALKYAVLNLVATTLFLIATGYLYGVYGTLNMADLQVKIARDSAPGAPLVTIASLYLAAFGMKAAAFPLNAWLPASYHTPKIVSSALLGGLLTKIGVYALLRVLVMLMPAHSPAPVVEVVAALTMLVGIVCALAESDIRRILGFVLISGVGVMLAGLALGDEAGLTGTIVYAVHSMLVMSALYLAAGIARDLGGSYSLATVAGLYDRAPFFAGAALLLFLSICGLPPGSGLWPKILLVKASIAADAGWLAAAILTSALLTTIVLGRVFLLAFWRGMDEGTAAPGARPPARAYIPLGVLLALSVAIGLYPEPLVASAARAAAGLLDPSAYVAAVFPEGSP